MKISITSSRSPWSGHSWFTKAFLWTYDWFALGFCCQFVWQCPSSYILKFYNEHISANHLDIGVGTGFFLDKCRFHVQLPSLVLLDLNPNMLEKAQKRLNRYHPQVYQMNIMESHPLSIPAFDSIGLSYILHCLPGTMATKEAVFQNIVPLLKPGGTVFGTTFLYKGVKRSPLATCAFWFTNLFRFMENKEDSLDALEQSLKKYFSEVYIEQRGCAVLFWARR